ncbi:MAG: hypothetical protein JNL10_13140 [Verrucomicrobiales bacterium]|nr:hypothetical protein [Verrucomicrobiales bacterium]
MPGNLCPRTECSVMVALYLAALISVGGLAAEPETTPFHGVPQPIPGRIEAEEFDRGGDGIAFHGAGPEFVGHPGMKIVRGRADAEISVGRSIYRQGPEQVWARSGEWMAYTVEVMSSGAYSILLKTGGAPTYAWETGSCMTPFQGGRGSVVYHLELDGFRVTPDLPPDPQVASPRIWMEAGRHQLRLVVDQVQDVSGLDALGTDDFTLFLTFPVDWMEVVRAPDLIIPTAVAGSTSGFRDGFGIEAQLGSLTRLVGETSAGNLVLFDEIHRAYRIASPEGWVWTVAGSPGNPPQDGTGDQAGFGPVVHSLVSAAGDILSLESQPTGGYRIAQVNSQGVVTTLYSGVPVAQMSGAVPGWESGETNMAVALARLEYNDRGELEVIGEFTEVRLFVCGPWSIAYDFPVSWVVRFQLVGQQLQSVALRGFTALPTSDVQDVGDGYRVDHRRLLREEPTGFVHEVLPGVTVISTLRAADRTLWAVIDGVLCRMAPDPEAGILMGYGKGGRGFRIAGGMGSRGQGICASCHSGQPLLAVHGMARWQYRQSTHGDIRSRLDAERSIRDPHSRTQRN